MMGAITAQVYYAFHKLFSLIKLANPHKGPVRQMLPFLQLEKTMLREVDPGIMDGLVSEAGFEPSTAGS